MGGEQTPRLHSVLWFKIRPMAESHQFLALPLKADGTPVEPTFQVNFESLRTTGDRAN